jgi:hypothetical protein
MADSRKASEIRSSRITLQENRYSYLPEGERDTQTLKSYTRNLIRYQSSHILYSRPSHGKLAAVDWNRYTMQCPMCRNYATSPINTDSDGIRWFTCQWSEHLQFKWPPFSTQGSDSKWYFSQDGRVQYGATIFTHHNPETGWELDDWIEWKTPNFLWEFDVKTETWFRVGVK